MQAKQTRIDAIMNRMQELSAAAVAAAEKNDLARVHALNIELEQATAEMQQLMSEGGTVEQIDAASQDASRDLNMRIAVVVNAGYEALGYEAESMPRPTAAAHAYRWRETQGNVTDETALLLLGHWQTTGDSLEPVSQANATPTAGQVISIRITAEESRIESVLDSIDFEALAALLLR